LKFIREKQLVHGRLAVALAVLLLAMAVGGTGPYPLLDATGWRSDHLERNGGDELD
jgi:hypothetical protein